MSITSNKYLEILRELKQKIILARQKASLAVNKEMLFIYWQIGHTILVQQEQEGWGTKVVDRLSKDLKVEFPDFKGLSARNLKYMRAFAHAYPNFMQEPLAQLDTDENHVDEFVQAGLAQLTWYHHITLLDKVKERQARLFYIKKTIENGWSRDIMVQQIETNLYERQGTAITNFSKTLPPPQSDLVKQALKSPYVFDFLSLEEGIQEKQLEKGLIEHLKKFMLELGNGFAYVGNQKNLVVDDNDYFLDLLFYNYHLHCFVVIELKVGEFKPEYAGKLNFYINTVNEQLKGVEDKATIGVLLCKTPNKTVVKYSLKGIDSPIGVAEYKLEKALPKQLRGEIPTVKELEAEIEKEYQELKTPSEKKFDALKKKLESINQPEVKLKKNYESLVNIIDQSLTPLFQSIYSKMLKFEDWFFEVRFRWEGSSQVEKDFTLLPKHWKDKERLMSNSQFYFQIQLIGFRKAGTETFDIHSSMQFQHDLYSYQLILGNNNSSDPYVKKLYDEQLTKDEINEVTDIICNGIMDQINTRLDRI